MNCSKFLCTVKFKCPNFYCTIKHVQSKFTVQFNTLIRSFTVIHSLRIPKSTSLPPKLLRPSNLSKNPRSSIYPTSKSYCSSFPHVIIKHHAAVRLETEISLYVLLVLARLVTSQSKSPLGPPLKSLPPQFSSHFHIAASPSLLPQAIKIYFKTFINYYCYFSAFDDGVLKRNHCARLADLTLWKMIINFVWLLSCFA